MKKAASLLLFLLATCIQPPLAAISPAFKDPEAHFLLGSLWWRRSSFNFGMERVKLFFPVPPHVTQNGLQLVATAYDRAACYTFTGYYSPIGNIDAQQFFVEKLQEASTPPYQVISRQVYQNTSGDWCLEYITEDHVRENRLYTFIVVTPFNSYTTQCVVPHIGIAHQYEYFRDSLTIQCECHQ